LRRQCDGGNLCFVTHLRDKKCGQGGAEYAESCKFGITFQDAQYDRYGFAKFCCKDEGEKLGFVADFSQRECPWR
jgi:hypothetical protein